VKSTVWATILIIVIIAAVIRLAWHYGSQPDPGEPVAHRMPAACAACGKAYDDKIGRQPAKCRYCGEVAVWRAVQCREKDCGAVFPLVREPGEIQVSSKARCPKCGSERYGEVRPNAIQSP